MKSVAWLLFLVSGYLMAGDLLLERFDREQCKGKLFEGATLQPEGGLEKGALLLEGNGKTNQICYEFSFACQADEHYALSFVFRTSDNYRSNSAMAEIAYIPAKGHAPIPTVYYRLPRFPSRWEHRMYEFTVPEGAMRARLLLRLAGQKPEETIRFDFLHLSRVVNGAAKGIWLKEFETAFDDWRFDKHLVFDHFMAADTSQVINEWKAAKVGEAFFQANGDGTKMQYGLYIKNLTVEPKRNYVFEGYYQATRHFASPASGMLIFFYKDAGGKAIGQSRFQLRDTKGAWQDILHTFTAPEHCVAIDIGLNMRKIPAEGHIRLDHLRFHPGASAAYMRHDLDPTAQTLQLTATVTSEIPPQDIQEAVFRFDQINGAEKHLFPVQPGIPQTIDIRSMPDGNYQLQLDVKLTDGRVLTDGPLLIPLCKHPSWTNDLGMNLTHAPAPWIDLTGDGNAVHSWRYDFVFSHDGLLDTLEDREAHVSLLDGPMAIRLNGEALATVPQAAISANGAAITRSAALQGRFNGTLVSRLDYTGFLHCTLELLPGKTGLPSSGELELGIREAEFLHRSDDSWTAVGSLALPDSWSTKHFYNEVTVGTVDRGLVIYLPRLYPAVENFEKPWLEITRQGRGAKIRVAFVNAQLPEDRPFRFEFALAPYPFRPPERNWRRLRFRAGEYSNFDLVWQSSRLFKYCGSTAEAADPVALRQKIANKKGTLLFYQIPFYIMDNIPEWQYFAKLWKGVPSRAYDMRSQGGMAFKADLRQKTWVDFYLNTLKKHLEEFDWDGVYYDCFGTDVFTENGDLFHLTFETRQFQERVYQVQRLRNPRSVTVTHLGAAEFNTAAAFSNLVLMGEQYRSICSRHTYLLEALSLDQFRYDNAVNLGPDRMFLPQYHEVTKIESPQVASSLMGLILTHNLMLYPNFINAKVERSVRDRQYAFGMEESDFFPYWKPQPDQVKVSNPKLVTSYYRNTNGYFLAILNPTADVQKYRLEIGVEKTGGPLHFDPATGTETNATPETEFSLQPYLGSCVTIPAK